MGIRSTIVRGVLKTLYGNKFNQAFYWGVGGGYTSYDQKAETYLEKGYQFNADVYSMINKMSTKSASIPIYAKKIKDERSLKQLKNLRVVTGQKYATHQRVKSLVLENKAFEENEIKELPLERPNPNQTWFEFFSLYKTYLRLTGNVYVYFLAPENGINAGEPKALYLLPSHLTQIVLRGDSNALDLEDPVKGYILTYGQKYIEFENENVIHIKYSNPEYDMHGAHLYGQSPLKAALRNLNSSNSAIDSNIKILQNNGAFGFIHGKSTPLTDLQTKSLKDRLIEMNNDPANLGRITAVSTELGFTRMSLTTDELKPFEYLKFDKEKLADCLDWEIIDSTRGDYGGTIAEIRKQRITDNIIPDLNLLINALNDEFLPRFKAYKGYLLEYDVMELPEMQEDVKQLSEWLNWALDRGVINRNEYRLAINYASLKDKDMDVHTVNQDVWTLNEAISSGFKDNTT